MTLIAEFQVELAVLGEASKRVPEMHFSGEDIIVEDDQPRKFVLSAEGGNLDEFEASLSNDPTVATYSVLQKFDQKGYYIVTYRKSLELKGTYHAALERDIVYIDLRLQNGIYHVRARVPDRDALRSFREYCRDEDIPFQLDRLYREEMGTDSRVGLSLTDTQRQTLEVAYERGYFENPRKTTLEEIGDELGISRQAVSARLRRAIEHIVEDAVL